MTDSLVFAEIHGDAAMVYYTSLCPVGGHPVDAVWYAASTSMVETNVKVVKWTVVRPPNKVNSLIQILYQKTRSPLKFLAFKETPRREI